MSGQHSLLSPSKAHRWITCPGSIALTSDMEEETSAYAAEGTAAHEVAAKRLEGKSYVVSSKDDYYVDSYVASVLRAAEGKTLLVEQRVDLSKWTTEVGGGGTADAIIVDLDNSVIEVHDLKFGEGHIVHAEQNEQLMLYALGATDLVDDIYGNETQSVKLVINQPRRDWVAEWIVSRADLLAFGKKANQAGALALFLTESGQDVVEKNLHPSEGACLWCPAKATCPALTKLVHDTVFEQFSDDVQECVTKPVDGAVSAGTLELIGQWAAAQLAWINGALARGEAVPGWKLVAGREGNRRWVDEEATAELLRKFRIKQTESHDFSVKTPAQLQKFINPKKWPKFEELIVRNEAKPVAVAATDKKPEYQRTTAADFD